MWHHVANPARCVIWLTVSSGRASTPYIRTRSAYVALRPLEIGGFNALSAECLRLYLEKETLMK